MTSTAKPVWLFDMDGTVLEVNSFPLWVRQILSGRMRGLGTVARAVISLRCATAIASRKVLRSTHRSFKSRLQRLWGRIEAVGGAAETFVDGLLPHVRPHLSVILADVAAAKVDAILTTAAPAEYAVPLGRRLGFGHVIATPAGGRSEDADNVGEAKRERTLSYLAAQGWGFRPRVLFTDHLDDLPLMRACATVVWFGTDSDYERVRTVLVGTAVLRANGIGSDAVYEWVRAHGPLGSAACT